VISLKRPAHALQGVPSVDPYLTAVVIKNIPFAMKEDELMTKIRVRCQ